MNDTKEVVVRHKTYFNTEKALAVLLLDNVIFLNDHWWENTWPEECRNLPSLNVNCNDVFCWGSADAVEIHHHEIQSLFEHWEKDKIWGPAIWCIKKENIMPQKPVYDDIMKKGIWNLDEMNLQPNLTWK